MSKKKVPSELLIPQERIAERIYFIRDQKVMLDEDLAELYSVPTKRLNQQVTRNIDRFPEDFMFRLTREEDRALRLQNVTLKTRGQHRKYYPRAFTEHGILMLASVLRSEQAVQVNIAIMRAFVRLRRWIVGNEELARRIVAMESKYDSRFKVVFDAIRELMKPTAKPARRIGFKAGES